MSVIVGIDIGGTFTDCVVADEGGALHTFKSPSTPSEPSVGLFDCLDLAAAHHDLDVADLLESTRKFTYGTTITTNILVERTGARTGLLTTQGFGDVLPISRIGRSELDADVRLDRPDPLVPRSRIREVPERVGPDGEVLAPLDEDIARERVDELVVEEDCEALAVAFLWAYRNPDHEQRVAAYAREEHGIDVTTSAAIAPLQGEYERSATGVLNAYLRPEFRTHLSSLDDRLADLGYAYPLMVMQSTGGLLTASEAGDRPVSTLYSGPAGAISASSLIGEQVGTANVINIDMGGTSMDVGVITDGQYETERTVRAGGHTILASGIDIHSIGAGGGSIAWLDKNRLRVGPRSAGAEPGPVCYGRGGTEPTVTDADLLLGYINPDHFVGGRLDLSVDAARDAVEERIAEPLGMSVRDAAAGIRRIVDANMADAIRVLTVEKGHDPRTYAIVACGGAGPMHAVSLAEELGVGEVVVPDTASVHSALGILASDISYQLSTTVLTDIEDRDTINDEYAALADEGAKVLATQGAESADIRHDYSADIRFKGQSHELELAVPEVPLSAADVERLVERFTAKYESQYGHGSVYEDATIEIVRLVVDSTVASAKPQFPDHEETDEIPDGARKQSREASFDGAFVETEVFDGEALRAGNQVAGPAVVERTGTTIVVPPGASARVDPHHNLRVTVGGPR